jgi:hypothetical protein
MSSAARPDPPQRSSRTEHAEHGPWLPLFVAETNYRNEAVNSRQATAGTLSVTPSRLVVSRTKTTPSALAVSMHWPPFALEKLDFRQSMPLPSYRSAPVIHWRGSIPPEGYRTSSPLPRLFHP